MARIEINMETSGTTWAEQVTRFGEAAGAVVTSALEGARAGALTDLRQEIGRAFPRSRRLPTTITGTVYPARADGAPPTLWIHPRKGSNAGAILAAHRGLQIVPTRSGTALAIPTGRVPNRPGGGGRMTPDEVSRHFGERLTVIPAKPGGRAWGYLVLRQQTIGRSGRVRAATAGRAAQGRRAMPIIMFVLVPSVTLAPRLRPEAIVQRWAQAMPDLIDQAAAAIFPRAESGTLPTIRRGAED